MTDHHQTVQHRHQHTAPADTIRVRQETVGDDVEQFVVRMPITSTAEARDGEAFPRERVDGFREQITAGGIGVFLDHGRNETTGSRYSALGKMGRLADPELVERGDATDLDVDFRFPMPDEIDTEAGTLREVLATLHSQARAGIPLTSSIGWSEDTGERDVPGDAEMLEASIVGIPSDPRTTTASAEPAALARAVSAASSGFDVTTFVRALTTGDRNTVEVDGEEIDLTPPEAVQNAAVTALAKDDELEPDCGTGADIGDEFEPAEGVTITGDEGEAVYLIHELDDSLEPPQYRRENVAKPESSLDESQADLPPLEGNFADEDNMTDDTDTESGDDPDPDREESDGMDAGEFRQSMLEMQQEQTEILREMREDGMGDDDEDDDEGDEEEESADADDGDERTVTLDGDEQPVDEALATLRDEYDAADAADFDAETQDRAEDADSETDDSDGFGMTGAMED